MEETDLSPEDREYIEKEDPILDLVSSMYMLYLPRALSRDKKRAARKTTMEMCLSKRNGACDMQD